MRLTKTYLSHNWVLDFFFLRHIWFHIIFSSFFSCKIRILEKKSSGWCLWQCSQKAKNDGVFWQLAKKDFDFLLLVCIGTYSVNVHFFEIFSLKSSFFLWCHLIQSFFDFFHFGGTVFLFVHNWEYYVTIGGFVWQIIIFKPRFQAFLRLVSLTSKL